MSLVYLYLLMLACHIFPSLIISLSEFCVKVNITKIIFSIFPPHLFSWWVWKGLDVWWNSEGELWGLDITNNLSWCSSNLFHITKMNYNMVGFCYCLEFLLKITTLVGMSKVMIQLDCLLIFFLIGSVDKCVFRYLLVTCIIFISKL